MLSPLQTSNAATKSFEICHGIHKIIWLLFKILSPICIHMEKIINQIIVKGMKLKNSNIEWQNNTYQTIYLEIIPLPTHESAVQQKKDAV